MISFRHIYSKREGEYTSVWEYVPQNGINCIDPFCPFPTHACYYQHTEYVSSSKLTFVYCFLLVIKFCFSFVWLLSFGIL